MKKENYKANGTKCEQLVNLEEQFFVPFLQLFSKFEIIIKREFKKSGQILFEDAEV